MKKTPPFFPVNYLLRHCREHSRYSIEDLAAALHLPPAGYEAIESGQAAFTSDQAATLARLLHVDADYLFHTCLQLDYLQTARDLLFEERRKAKRTRAAAPAILPIPALSAGATCPSHLQAVIRLFALALQPCYIFLFPGPHRADLLIILPDACADSFAHLNVLLKAFCAGPQAVYFILHRQAAFARQRTEGHLFYSTACTAATLVYSQDDAPLPPSLFHHRAGVLAVTEPLFEAALQKAEAFLRSAGDHQREQQPGLAAYALQQAAELSCRALLNALGGPDIKTHSIVTQLKNAALYAPALATVFADEAPDTTDRLLQLLEKAHVAGRYGDLPVAPADLSLLLDRIAQLPVLIRQAFDGYVSRFRSQAPDPAVPAVLLAALPAAS